MSMSHNIQTTHSLEHYKNHIKFLGYSVEDIDQYTIYCKNPRKYNIGLTKLSDQSGVLARLLLYPPEKYNHELVLLLLHVNELNKTTLFVKTYLEQIDYNGNNYNRFVIESVLEGEYHQTNFSIFLDNIDNDMQKIYQHPLPNLEPL